MAETEKSKGGAQEGECLALEGNPAFEKAVVKESAEIQKALKEVVPQGGENGHIQANGAGAGNRWLFEILLTF